MPYEGAYELGSDTAVSLTGSWTDDGGLTDGDAITIAAVLNMDRIYGHAAFYDLGEGLDPDAAGESTSPWNATFGYMVVPGEWEAAVRYENVDDMSDTTQLTLGASWYFNGAANKWQLNWVSIDSDAAALEGDLIQLGCTLSF
jgi:hypothetical protein